MDQLPRLGKRELICLLCLPVIMWFLFGEVSSSSGCMGWATLLYCGTPWAFNIIIIQMVNVMLLQLEIGGGTNNDQVTIYDLKLETVEAQTTVTGITSVQELR